MSRAYPCARQRRLRLPLSTEPLLERHQVLELVYDLAAAVAVARPRDPLPFFLHFLQASQNIKFCPRIMLLPSEEVSKSFSDVAALMANMAGLELLTRDDLVWGGILSSDGVARPQPVEEEEEAESEAATEEEEEEEEEQEKEKAEEEAEAEAAQAEEVTRQTVGSLLVEGPVAEAVAAVTAARSTLCHALEAAVGGAEEGGTEEGGAEEGGAEEASSTASSSSSSSHECVPAVAVAAVAAGRPMRCWGCAAARAGVTARWLLSPHRQASGWLLADAPASRAEAEALRRAGLLPTHLLQMRELLCPSHYEPPHVDTTVAAAPTVAVDTVLTSSVEWAGERSRASCVEPQAYALAVAHTVATAHAEAREQKEAAAREAAAAVAAAAAAAAAAQPEAKAKPAAAERAPVTAEAAAVLDVATEALSAAVDAAATEAEAKARAAAKEAAAKQAWAEASARADAKAAEAVAAAAAGVCVRTHRHERDRRQGPMLDETRSDTEGVLSVFRHTPLVRVVAVRGGDHEQMALAALGQAFARRAPRGHSWVPRIALVGPQCAGLRWHQQRLSFQFGLCPVDFLTLLREEPRPPQTSVERLSWLVPASRAVQIVARRLAERDCVISGWVLVGFPRDADDLRHLDATTFPPNRVFLFNNSVEWCLRHAAGGALVRRARRAAGARAGVGAGAQGEPSKRALLAAARLLGARGEPLLRDSVGYARRLAGLRALCESSATVVDGERGRALVYHQLRAALAQAAPPAPPRAVASARRAQGLPQPHARFPSELPHAKSPSPVSPRSPAANSPRAVSAAPSAATVRSRLAATVPTREEDPEEDAAELQASLVQQ